MKKLYLFYSSELNRFLDYTILRGKTFLHQASAETQKTDIKTDIILHQAGAEFGNLSDDEQIPTIFTFVPWKHHVEIISKCESIEEAIFYIKLTVAESLSKQGLMVLTGLMMTLNNAMLFYKGNIRVRTFNNLINLLGIACTICMLADFSNFEAYVATICFAVAVQISNFFAIRHIPRSSV